MSLLSSLFGSKTDFKELYENGGVIIDVRTKAEFDSGHIKGSINLPLDKINAQIGRYRKDKILIVCCASGMRSGSAVRILKSEGYEQTFNGGGWRKLESRIS